MNKEPRSKEELLGELTFLLWRNYPRSVSTFGPCSRACGSKLGARGSGVCALCAEKDLAALVGEAGANYYHAHIREIRRLERQFERVIHGEQEPETGSSASLAQSLTDT